MANANQNQQSQSQSRQDPPSPISISPPLPPRIVSFVIDRDHIVTAEVIRSHPDGALDLRGKFGQPIWKEKKSIDERTGEVSDVFTEPEQAPDETVSIRARVRQADEGEVRVGRLTPGTWFSSENRGGA